MIHKEYKEFIKTIDISDEQRSRMNVIIEFGNSLTLLQELIQKSSADLVAFGSRPRRLLVKVFRNSITTRIISSLLCDALVIRG